MEHSAQAYLQGRSSVELAGILQTCMLKNQWEQYAEFIPRIFEILEDRGVIPSDQIIDSWNGFLYTRQNSW